MVKVKRAIISVSDKEGIVELAGLLRASGVELLSTGGTAKLLRGNGIECVEVSDFTGFPEILDGRVKTLNPKIYGGLLALRDNSDHLRQMADNGIVPIDLVVCNLYPFEETLKKGSSDEEIIENIDIGGPTMLRAAAKNYRHVCVLSGKKLYEPFMREFKEHHGAVSPEFSMQCAAEVFRLTAGYDSAISSYFGDKHIAEEGFPEVLDIVLDKIQALRYGENPHQPAAWYGFRGRKGSQRRQLHGRELSFNNLLDIESTYSLVNQFSAPACIITKHTNPCGAAVAGDSLSAYNRALETDPLSAFGGIAGFNCVVGADLAREIITRFYEVVVAPGYEPEALDIFRSKENLRIIQSPPGARSEYDFRTLNDGFLVQCPDESSSAKMNIVTEKKPSSEEMDALEFAWTVCKFVKSNSIVIGTLGQTLGIGAGQMSRYDAARVAVMKMGDNFKSKVQPVVMASDAFFPFPDSIEVAKKAGVSAVIQPGGSLNDPSVIDTCDSLGISMVFTGMRHFRH